MSLTPEAKKLLAETIRGTHQDPDKGLRGRLLRAIHDEADRRYRLSVPIANAGLDETHKRRRERIEAWIEERARATKPKNKAELKTTQDRLLQQAEKEAAATLVNRLVLLRLVEAQGLSKPPVLTGGWNSKGYREFREFAPTLCTNGTTDGTEGYATLLQLVFDELGRDLPGLFGDVGLTRLFAIPAATLRDIVERLDDPGLVTAWTDDTTRGWVYQYWNDPDREGLDAKINSGGKIEPHEIASKTQMFTERYMVEWLLQNSLGLTWLAMCKKHGWTAHAERVLPVLDNRRAQWRVRRETGEVALDALMPIDGELEEHWKYYVPQPIPEDAIEKAPESVRAIKILDPACGSGHFLVIAFGLLVALYREEAVHLGKPCTDREIAESILENNLYGIDIDPRAIQIAAAGLYLKAKSFAKDARPKTLNLVAPVLQLGSLPPDDPAVVHLREDLKQEVGIPAELTNKLLTSLAGVDYLGSLFKVDEAIESSLRMYEASIPGQSELFMQLPITLDALTFEARKLSILDKLEQFLAKHSSSEDLGLRLDGEQLASGVRFVRIAKEGLYDLVVGNPPYQGISKTSSFDYVATAYPRGKADLYAAFLERGLELTRAGGLCAMVTMQGWMFLGQFTELRRWILEENSLRCLADLMWCAFENMRHATVAMAVAMRGAAWRDGSVALAPTDRSEREESILALRRKRAALLAHVGRYEFEPRGFKVIEGEPIVYWWNEDFLSLYAMTPKLGALAPARNGMSTQDNTRFLRRPWEVRPTDFVVSGLGGRAGFGLARWAPYIKGASGQQWFEPLDDVVQWDRFGLEPKAFCEHLYRSHSRTIKNEALYFRQGIAFAAIGAHFSARAHRTASVFGHMGTSVFPDDIPRTLCLLNSSRSKDILGSLNPGLHFLTSDVNRLPVFPVEHAQQIYDVLDKAFSDHETAREPSAEFLRPGPSAWLHAQAWAQGETDRQHDSPQRSYEPVYEPAVAAAHVSFAVGVALGRFGAEGRGLLSQAPSNALSSGMLFVSAERCDSLDAEPCRPVVECWNEHGTAVSGRDDLGTYLRKSFFEFHKKSYDKRPVHFPLSSAKRHFVAFVSIHRWTDDTLSVLLADHLFPTKRRLEGELDDLRTARASGGNKGKAEKRFADVQRLIEELNDFIEKVTEIAEKGPPPPDDKTLKRESDARFSMDLDDGVMVNSAALWPLLEPQWKDPKKWWKELANAQGKKDYDWSRQAARYFPSRVRTKCHEDPSLAVAHKCFWELHPAKAYAWELRLQDEIRLDFTIDEPASDTARATFLREHDAEAREILAKELKRREKKAAKADDAGDDGPLFETTDAEQQEDALDA